MKNIAVKTSGVNQGFGQGESRTEAQLQRQRAISTILLAKALGGGWQRPDVEQLTASK